MLSDATGADRAAFARDFDVCVAGAGPAGITLARRLAARGLDVALMEAGGLEVRAESQDVFAGESVGLDYFPLDMARLRYLGGTSGHWGGRCRPLDARDFRPAAPNPLSGWPIAKAELDPYQAETEAILDLAPGGGFPDLAIVQAAPRFRAIPWRISTPPTRFGDKYLDALAAEPKIALALNASLVDLRLAQDLATVEAAVFRSPSPGDAGFAVRARAFALCAGAIETPRLMLNFTSQKPAGIGNDHDLVGRFFCEHPHVPVGKTEFEAPRTAKESFAPTEAFMAEQGILNFALFLTPEILPPLPLGGEFRRSVQCLGPFTERLAARVLGRRPNCDVGGLGAYLDRRFGTQGLTGDLRIVAEQSLIRDSRVGLAAAADAFGLRRARLDWRLAAVDAATVRTATLAFGAHLAEQRIGRLRLHDWLRADGPAPVPVGEDRGTGGPHPMCTTRMADDPREGVVDRDCRVHGTANLYVGGSSVFATGGHANPTYTVVQLALRLGDHLAGQPHT